MITKDKPHLARSDSSFFLRSEKQALPTDSALVQDTQSGGSITDSGRERLFWSRRRLATAVISEESQIAEVAHRHGAAVVSVDLFDTLAYRRLQSPTDLFLAQFAQSPLLQQLCASASQWLSARKNAERDLVKRSAPTEVQLVDIYGVISRQLKLLSGDSEKLMELELELEAQSIRPYPTVVATLEALVRSGISIAITTDTYLPEPFIRSVLDSFVPFGYTLLCSSSTGATKRSGSAYALLAEHFRGKNIVHFGDNETVDERNARKSGIQGFTTRWRRQLWLDSNPERLEYLRLLGAYGLITPEDGNAAEKDAYDLAREEVAWRWSATLVDFLACVKDYAAKVEATDIWFMSRDCETMYRALTSTESFSLSQNIRYVICSRASFYPIIAEDDPERFRSWTGRLPTPQDLKDGQAAALYYGSLVGPESKRVLIVDIGWKGRLQAAIRAVLPSSIGLKGYYFALEPKADAVTRAESETFMTWDQSVMHQASIECLSGFFGDSCEKFVEDGTGAAVPTFRSSPDDRASEDYCSSLLKNLVYFLDHAGPRTGAPARLRHLRWAAVRAMCAFPDIHIARLFRNWSTATEIYGNVTAHMILDSVGPLSARLRETIIRNSIWPAGNVWSLARSRLLVQSMQAVIYFRKRLKARHKLNKVFDKLGRKMPDGDNP